MPTALRRATANLAAIRAAPLGGPIAPVRIPVVVPRGGSEGTRRRARRPTKAGKFSLPGPESSEFRDSGGSHTWAARSRLRRVPPSLYSTTQRRKKEKPRKPRVFAPWRPCVNFRKPPRLGALAPLRCLSPPPSPPPPVSTHREWACLRPTPGRRCARAWKRLAEGVSRCRNGCRRRTPRSTTSRVASAGRGDARAQVAETRSVRAGCGGDLPATTGVEGRAGSAVLAEPESRRPGIGCHPPFKALSPQHHLLRSVRACRTKSSAWSRLTPRTPARSAPRASARSASSVMPAARRRAILAGPMP
jgi:hypothetical protein